MNNKIIINTDSVKILDVNLTFFWRITKTIRSANILSLNCIIVCVLYLYDLIFGTCILLYYYIITVACKTVGTLVFVNLIFIVQQYKINFNRLYVS